jgi:hypothetical protein
MNTSKPITWIVGGALVAGVGICEARENPHVEQRAYEEPPRLTYDLANSTATMSIGHLLLPEDFQPVRLKVMLKK